MSRYHRVTTGGTVYHVLNRAANRHQIFCADEDYRAFVRLILTVARLVGMRVLAYCIMPNHWHLILWPAEDGSIPRFIHRLSMRHALCHRRRTNSIGHGHVYQAPYRSFPVQTERYYYNAVRYVEANALRAGIVQRAEDWAWSSAHLGTERTCLAAGPLQLPADWVELVNQAAPSEELDVVRTCAHTGRPFGSDDWVRQTAIALGLEHTLRAAGRPAELRRNWFC